MCFWFHQCEPCQWQRRRSKKIKGSRIIEMSYACVFIAVGCWIVCHLHFGLFNPIWLDILVVTYSQLDSST
jgi:hypothetical protein